MNHVERFRAVMRFEPVDRLPRWEWAMWWDKTLTRWRGEGLPIQSDDVFAIHDHFGLDPYKQFWFSTTQDTIEAVQHHVEGVVATLDDYLEIRPRIFPPHQAAIESMRPWGELQSRGEAVVWVTLEGFFWFARTLLGFERLMFAYCLDAELLHRIAQDLLDYNLGLLERMSKVCVPTFMTLAEDMSYNNGPMISRQTFEDFLAPYYRKLMARVRELGMLSIVDTDGDVTLMVPWLQATGVDGILPLERQAGVDAAKLREQFPNLCMIGHFDKMTMNRGEPAMRAEFERLLPVMNSGGFIPSVDHQTPPGVSLEEYRIYLRLLGEYTARVRD